MAGHCAVAAVPTTRSCLRQMLLRRRAHRAAAASAFRPVGRSGCLRLSQLSHRRANESTAAAAVGSPAFKVSRSEYERNFSAATYTPGSYEFWLDVAREEIDWFNVPTQALQGRLPGVQVENRWFPDGTTNLCLNALDRHVAAGYGARTAIAYHSAVGGNSRDISYQEMLDDVASFAGSLRELGVEAGDRVLLYMPMIPEAAVAMLACTRIGAVHSVVFGGFAAPELAVRIDDAKPKVVVAATCGLEGAKGALAYMPAVNQAIELASFKVSSVVVVQRDEIAAAGVQYELQPSRDYDFNSMVAGPSRADCVPLSASDPLYTIYTSGTTGDPKGILRDNSHAVTLKWSMAAYYGTAPGETFFAASDIGWVVGHSYIVCELLHIHALAQTTAWDITPC